MSKVILTLLLSLASCGPLFLPRESASAPVSLTERRELYLRLNSAQQDSNGFILTQHCDSLLFSSLNAVGRGERIQITAARDEEGQWFRRPLDLPECYANRESRSTISRDMLIGLLLYLQHFQESKLVADLWNYGSTNNWIMGEGEGINRVAAVLSPSLIKVLAEMNYKMNGVDADERHLPDLTIFTKDGGYVNHLNLLYFKLYSEVYGGITVLQYSELQRYVNEIDPNNLLGLALLSKYTKIPLSLNKLNVYPAERLPTTADWCEEWYYQRQTGDVSQLPCEPTTVHTGGDFLFLLYIINSPVVEVSEI